MLVGVCAEYQEWNILRFSAENAIQEHLMSVYLSILVPIKFLRITCLPCSLAHSQ